MTESVVEQVSLHYNRDNVAMYLTDPTLSSEQYGKYWLLYMLHFRLSVDKLQINRVSDNELITRCTP